MLLVTSGARAPLLPLSLLLLLLLATLASQLQRGEANPVAQQLDYVKGKGETRADKRGASTPTVKKEGPRDELDEDVASIFDSDPDVSPSGAGSRTSAAGSTTTTTGKPSGDSLDGGDELVDPLNHAAKSRVSDALADTSTTTTTSPSPSPSTSTTAHPSGGSSRSDVFDLEERREGNAPIVVLKIHPVSRKNKNGGDGGDDGDDDDDESAPSAKPTLSPVVDKLVRENKGQTDANGTVTLTLSGNHTFKEIEALNKTGEIVSEVILSTTKLPGRKGRKSTTTTKRPKTSTTSTRKPAGSRKTTGKQKASTTTTTTTTTRNPKFTIGFDSNYNRTREASGNTTLTIKHEMGGPDTTTTTKNPKSTTTTTKKPKSTTTTKKPKTTTTTKKPTTTTKKPTTTTSTKKPTTTTTTSTTKKPAQTNTTTKKPWWKIKPPPLTTTTAPTTKPLNGTAPAAGSCAIRPDCQCDYKELQDSDRMLAVVITNRGGFKGRRLNAKALTSLMKAQASVQQLRDIARQKSISVSTNNTFVLPAGHYYFPTSIRFAGFQAP